MPSFVYRPELLATVVAALVSSVSFARFGLRPWQAVPLGLGVGVIVFAVAHRLTRRGS